MVPNGTFKCIITRWYVCNAICNIEGDVGCPVGFLVVDPVLFRKDNVPSLISVQILNIISVFRNKSIDICGDLFHNSEVMILWREK